MSTWKFSKQRFGPYVVTSAKHNATYHLDELEGTRIAVPIVGKQVRDFKKWYESKPDVDMEEDDVDMNKELDKHPIDDGSGEDHSRTDRNPHGFITRHIP